MESMEDFSFKPITDGLGFHRKKVELKDQMKAAKVVHEAIGRSVPIKPKSEAPMLKTPLPKKEMATTTPTPAPTAFPSKPSKDVIDEIVRNFKKPNEKFVEDAPSSTPKVIINPTKPQIDEASNPLPWMISAFFVDSMLVVALVLSSLLATLMVTDADLMQLFANNPEDWWLRSTIPAIFIVMTFAYMTMSRILMGASIGEIVFDVHLGTEAQRQNVGYSLRVILRSTLAIVSGLVVLPFFSLLLKQDYLGDLSGLRLYPKKRRG